MALTFSPTSAVEPNGMGRVVRGTMTFDSSYVTGGESYAPSLFGLSAVESIDFKESVGGYVFEHDKTNKKVKALTGGAGSIANESAHTHAVALDSGASAAGSSHNHAFTGAASALDLASPVFSGTGLTAAGQVMTTTDNQTMTLNQCAGMWLIPATGSSAPMLILSNTAVTGAPAVLTVQGTAATDAGAYKIVATLPLGSNAAEATHTHGPGTLADAASGAGSAHTHSYTGTTGAEVANATNLSTVAVEVTVFGV